MKNHSLILLLKTFTEDEIRLFMDFLNSPYFNKRKAVAQLFALLRNFYPAFTDKRLTKEYLYGKLFPGKKFNYSTFRVIISMLNELALKFTAQRYFENNIIENELIKVKALIRRNHLKNLKAAIARANKSISYANPSAEDFFYYNFSFFDLKNIFAEIKYSGMNDKNLTVLDFNKPLDNLAAFFTVKTLKIYIIILNLNILYMKDFDTDILERNFNNIDKTLFNKYPVIEIFYYLVVLLKNSETEDIYFKVKKLLYDKINILNKHDICEILINLGNYCSRKISSGNTNFMKEKFELLKKELSHKTFNIEGFMTFVYYKTAINMSLAMKDYKFAKSFIDNYTIYISENNRTNALHYGKALYEFTKKHYGKALEYLSMINFHDLYSKLDLKVFQIVIFYEMGFEEAIESSLEAFRHFLKNNKLISKNKLPYYLNFYRAIRKIIKIKKAKDIYEKKIFEKYFLLNNMFINKGWIKEKLDQISFK